MATSPSAKPSSKPAPPPKPKAPVAAAGIARGPSGSPWDNEEATPSRLLHPALSSGGAVCSNNWRKSASDRSPSSSASESTRSVEPKQQKSSLVSSSRTSQGSPAWLLHKTGRSPPNHPSLKPALLPKPQLTPPSSAGSSSGSRRGGRLKASHPDLVLSTEHRQQRKLINGASKTAAVESSPAASTVKAPVAKLDEFEGTLDRQKVITPVRPPRSPKNKVFPQGPFVENTDVKPAIPIKKKSLLALQADKQRIEVTKLDVPTIIERKAKSASLGRIGLPSVKVKSASLGRNVQPLESPPAAEFESHYWDIASGPKSAPVPPPRRSRRHLDPKTEHVVNLGHTLCRSISLFSYIEETEKNIPIYAVVNYNLKRNRRQNVQNSSTELLNATTTAQIAFNFDLDASTSEDNILENSDLGKVNQNFCDTQNLNKSFDSVLKIDNSKASEEVQNVSVTVESSNCQQNIVNSVIPDGGVAAIKQDKGADRDKENLDNVMGNSECSGPDASQSSRVFDVAQAEQSQANSAHQSESNQLNNVECDVLASKLDEPHVSAESTSSQTAHKSLAQSVTIQTSEGFKSCDVADDVKQIEDVSKNLVEKLSDKWSSAEAIEDSCASSKLEYLSAKASIHSSLSDIMPDILGECEGNDDSVKPCEFIIDIMTQPSEFAQQQVKHLVEIFDGVDRSIENAISFLGSRDQTSQSNQEVPKILVSNSSSVNAKDACTVENTKPNGTAKVVTSNIAVAEKERAKSMPHLNSSSNKQGSPSPDRVLLPGTTGRRRRFRGQSPWCDEGELSTGVLADLDSSDANRQSSVDDVGASDTEEATPVRRKLSSLIPNFTKNMLRKSGRKSKESKKESLQSHFYFNKPSNSSETEDKNSSTLVADTSTSVDTLEESSMSQVQLDIDGEQAQASLDTISIHTTHSVTTIAHSESDNDDDYFVDSVPDISLDPTLSVEQKQAKKAFQIAEEIMTSERVFVDVLKLLCVDFRSFVEAVSRDHKNPIISECDLSKILNHLPQILSLNQDLLQDLEQRIISWSNVEKISDVIVKKGPFLKLYTSYIQSFESQCNFLDECCQKNHTFGKVVQDFEGTARCRKLSLKHYMLKPVQRVPQYRLLLENYVRCLQPHSVDFQDTETALQIVCEVADHANRSMKEGDALSKLLKLQSLLGHYELIKPGRTLLREGELLKVCRKVMQPRYFILLNDCLLYTTYIGSGLSSGLKVNNEIQLQQMKVNISAAEDYKNEFSIISVTRSFTLVANSPEEVQHWVHALQTAIQEKATKQSTFLHAQLTSLTLESGSLKLGKEAPIWIPDRRVTMCQICTAEFTVTFRRHHCRACGKVVCGDCSANKAPLQYMKFQPARVCNDCFNILLKEFEDPTFTLPEDLSHQASNEILESAKIHFKKAVPLVSKKSKKYIPQRLKEVSANDAGCQISGWLQRLVRHSWKRMWFVLKEQVLYVYKASEDVVALESIPVLGYQVETFAEKHFQLYEGIDAKLVFTLTHKGQPQLVFHAENFHAAQRWFQAMQEATVL